MLFACLTLSICVTSCSSDEFETHLPEEQRQYTKAELIEQALSRMPQTRTNLPVIILVSIKQTVTIQCSATENIEINWDEEEITSITKNSKIEQTHTFSNGNPSHFIRILGPSSAITSLTVDNNELISLDASYNSNISFLSCIGNHLDELDLTKFPKLHTLDITNNEFSNIDITCLPQLQILRAANNQLATVEFSKNLNLHSLNIERNKITNLDLNKNTNLTGIVLSHNPITNLDLSKNKDLLIIFLENVPIKTINDVFINDTIFSFFPKLQYLNIAYTSFDALNLSSTPLIRWIDISGTAITQLDISNLQIQLLNATRSKLTNLICEQKDLKNLYELRIERTPFEKEQTNMMFLDLNLPIRYENHPGHLYTYSPHINNFAESFRKRNWLINQ